MSAIAGLNVPEPPRRGPRTPAELDPAVKVRLEAGEVDTVNFAEQFAIDIGVLTARRLPEVPAVGAQGLPLKARLRRAADALSAVHAVEALAARVADECDTLRAVAALAVARADRDPAKRLTLLQPFADDPHFAVREWAWIGLRDELHEELLGLAPELAAWTSAPQPNLRRFVSEISRPRGVWCRHLGVLRSDPGKAVGLIEPLRADESRYVRMSVANWLNDASKDNPEWVRSICSDWSSSGHPHTLSICKRGLRSVGPTT